MDSEVAIVGGGFAGLAAARALAERGVDVVIYEATDRLGGRARTVEGGVELGPEFVHGQVPATLALAREAGVPLEPLADRHYLRHRGEVVPIDLWKRFDRLPDASGVSAHAYLERTPMTRLDASLFALLVEGFYAAPLDDISVAYIAADRSAPGDEGLYRVRGGYGRLVDYLAARANVPVRYRCVVQAIDWSRDRVELAYRQAGVDGVATARRAIVTLPIGVLQAGGVVFGPGLGDHGSAIAKLAMGQVVKLVLVMREPVWPPGIESVHGLTTAFPTFWMRDHQLVAWAGGPKATALARYSLDQLVERAVDEAAGLLAVPRARVAGAVLRAYHHDYHGDPFARGAYSYTRAGGAGASEQLARPLGGLVFAGEATDPDLEGTVGGALASGIRAAEQLMGQNARRRSA